MKNSGVFMKLSDGRKVIVYNHQPLIKEKGKVILNLIDDQYNLMKDDNGKPKIIIKEVEQYNLENESGVNKLIGFTD